MKNKIYKIALVLGVFLFAYACDEDTFTEDSSAVVASPSLTVSLDFDNTVTLVEQETTYGFTVSLSEPQITDVRVNLTQVSGDATNGEDFSMPSSLTIPTGSTSASDVFAIHADDLIEDYEEAVIKIATGVESNVSEINSEFVTLRILNLTEGDLAIGLEWATSGVVSDNAGNVFDATDFADLRLVISSTPDNAGDIGVADGGSFELFSLPASSPDGDYYVVADFYAVEDIPSTLDLTVSFDQVGVINGQTHMFPAAMNSAEACPVSYTVLAKVTKTGDTYAFEEIGTPAPLDLNNFVGSWTGTTSYGYETQMVTTLNGSGQLEITGVGVGFMELDWGEVIVDMQSLVMDIDIETGEFTIAEAYYMETTYNGDPQPVYNLVGSGTISGTCTPSLYLDYDFIQGGTSYTDWLTIGNGWPAFEEDNTIL